MMGGGIPYPPIIVTSSLPDAAQNQPYSTVLSAINGFPPYSWSLVAGPPGLAVSTGGTISWTPTTSGPFTVTVSVRDNVGGTSTSPSIFTLTVDPSSAAFDFYISPTAPDSNNLVDGIHGVAPDANAWSINALNNTNCRNAYSGKRVGLMDGIYAVYNTCLLFPGDVVFNVRGSSNPASPTVISAVNSRKAVIDAHQIPGEVGTGYCQFGGMIIGQWVSSTHAPLATNQIGNTQIIGLVVTGAGTQPSPGGGAAPANGTANSIAMMGNYNVVTAGNGAPGIVVQDCEVYDCLGWVTTNSPLIRLWAALNGVVRNCLVHDNYRLLADASIQMGDGVQTFTSYGNTYENNTFYNCEAPIYEKYAQGVSWNGNSTIRYNYIEANGVVGFEAGYQGDCIYDCQGGNLGFVQNVYNNILVTKQVNASFWAGIDDRNTTGAPTPLGVWQSCNFYNNTCYGMGSSSRGVQYPQIGNLVSPAATMSQYNNLFIFSVAAQNGWVQNTSQNATISNLYGTWDFNYYGYTNTIATPFASYDPLSSTTDIRPLRAFYNPTQWRGLGLDINSTIGGAVSGIFQNPGQPQNPVGYQLTNGSPAHNFGHVGGIPAGAACDAGAWGGASPPTQIGASFLSTKLSPAADPFPRTVWQVIAPLGNGGYQDPVFIANAAKFNMVCCGPYMGMEQLMGTTFASIFASIKSQSTLPTPTRCFHYTMSSEQSLVGAGGNSSTYTVWSSTVNSANWWTRTNYPGAGPIVTFDTNSGLLAINSQNNVTFSGQTIYQAFWNHYDGVFRQGNAVAQGYAANLAFAPNIYIDGYQMDNCFAQPRKTADWAMNGTSMNPNFSVSDGAPLADGYIQQGQAQQVAALRALNPAALVWGNCDYFVRSTSPGNFSYNVALDPSQNGLWDVVYCQSAVGGSNAIEGQGGTTTAQMMANLTAAEAQVRANGTLVFEQAGASHGVGFSNSSQASWTTADWQAARFGIACACLRNYHYSLNNQVNAPNLPYFMDEYTQRGVTGWLGQSYTADAPQTGSRVQGVWYRNFPKTGFFPGGVVFMNPAGNGVQTINLAGIGLSGLSAIAHSSYGDATVNTGAAVTSITLQDRDGRFLIYS